MKAWMLMLGVLVAAPACGGDNPDTEQACGDGIDNDSDGKTDCSDSDCANDQLCQNPQQNNVTERCDNGVDDDGDQLADCQDPDCADSCVSSGLRELCSNGIDDDGDGFVDCADVECGSNIACGSPTPTN